MFSQILIWDFAGFKLMLRNRYRRAVRSSRQGEVFSPFSDSTLNSSSTGLMPDQWVASSSPTKSPSPRFFNGFLSKNVSDPEHVVVSSPTSILDTENSSIFVNLNNPFGYVSKSPTPTSKQESQAIGLALIDSIIEDESDGNFSKPVTRMVLFGSKLKVHIPEANPSPPPAESPKSPAEFGIKTRSSSQSQFMSPLSNTRDLMRQLSLKEMELSEDYTCVITHGANPKTTHIFNEYIVESCSSNNNGDTTTRASQSSSNEKKMESPIPNFLSFCHYCKDILRQDKDIYMYRGENAFCSNECRSQEMMIFKGIKNQEEVNDGSY